VHPRSGRPIQRLWDRPGSAFTVGTDQSFRSLIADQDWRDGPPYGDAIQRLAAPLAGIAASDGLQISQSLLAEAALVNLSAMLEQTAKRFREVADLQGWHRPQARHLNVLVLYAACIQPNREKTGLLMLLPQDLRLTPEQFALVCNANPDAVLELAADGSVLSPDASVVRLERWQALSPEQRRGFPPLCPDLVIELASASDDSPRGAQALRRKMAAYQANGAQLGWLLFPEQRAVEIWQAHSDSGAAATPERLDNAMRLEGGDLLPGLVLELEEIWAA